MGHIDLRDLDDDDLDAIFEMMRDPAADRVAPSAADPDNRASFDAWMSRQRADPGVSLWVVTEDGGFAGTAAAFAIDGDREVTCWIARHARGRGVGTATMRLLVAREAIRPLYTRVSTENGAATALLTKLGFTQVSGSKSLAPNFSPDVDVCVFVLPPTLE